MAKKSEGLQDYLKTWRDLYQASKWSELVLFFQNNNEFDNALVIILNHPVEAWNADTFKDMIKKVSSKKLCFDAIDYYVGNKPSLLNDLLNHLSEQLGANEIFCWFETNGKLEMIKEYMRSVQNLNKKFINEAINDFLIEEGDHQGLKASIDAFDNFDNIALAQRLERHELLEFRRISADLYQASLAKKFTSLRKAPLPDKTEVTFEFPKWEDYNPVRDFVSFPQEYVIEKAQSEDVLLTQNECRENYLKKNWCEYCLAEDDKRKTITDYDRDVFDPAWHTECDDKGVRYCMLRSCDCDDLPPCYICSCEDAMHKDGFLFTWLLGVRNGAFDCNIKFHCLFPCSC